MTHPIAASQEVKTIRTRIKQIGVEISHLDAECGRLRKEKGDKIEVINKLKSRLKEMEGVDLEITDHAILRYLQRAEALDVDKIKALILTEQLREQVETVGGTGKFPGPNGTRLVMENKRIISVIPA